MRSTPSVWPVLATYLRPQWARTLVLACLVLAAIGLELANPQILRVFIDSAMQSAAIDRLVAIGLVFLAVAVASQAAFIAETYVAENVGLTATNALRADLTLHCLRLDPEFLNSHTPGELIERVDGDVATLANFFSRFPRAKPSYWPSRGACSSSTKHPRDAGGPNRHRHRPSTGHHPTRRPDRGVREWGPREALAVDPASAFSALLRTGARELLA